MLISSPQAASVKIRFIGESGRLISDITEISSRFNIKKYLVIMDIEKAFDSLEHSILISILIETLLKDQQLCVINDETTTQYFNLERGTCQGDPISAYLFIPAFQILFLRKSQNKRYTNI